MLKLIWSDFPTLLKNSPAFNESASFTLGVIKRSLPSFVHSVCLICSVDQ